MNNLTHEEKQLVDNFRKADGWSKNFLLDSSRSLANVIRHKEEKQPKMEGKNGDANS